MTDKIDLCCLFCGDSCGDNICYACQDSVDDLGLDIDDILTSM